MGRQRENVRELERGALTFFYRPRVEQFEPEGIEDVQRFLLVLTPADRSRFRVVAVGRKRMPRGGRHERFWGYVDLVLHSETDFRAALGAQTYGTRTRGIRHLPAARPAADGTYRLEWHDGHAHLSYALTSIEGEDDVVKELGLAREGDYIVTVANPDPTAWGLSDVPDLQYNLFDEAEVHVTIPSPFPPDLQAQFGDKRFVQLDTTGYLDHPGAELIFIAAE